MAATLKASLGEGGSFIGDSSGQDNLYDVLKELAATQNLLVAAFNQLLTDYNAETAAAHTASSATAIPATSGVTVE